MVQSLAVSWWVAAWQRLSATCQPPQRGNTAAGISSGNPPLATQAAQQRSHPVARSLGQSSGRPTWLHLAGGLPSGPA